jgi:hypothetical protein
VTKRRRGSEVVTFRNDLIEGFLSPHLTFSSGGEVRRGDEEFRGGGKDASGRGGEARRR